MVGDKLLVSYTDLECDVGPKVSVAHILTWSSAQQTKYRIKRIIIVEYQNLHKTLMKNIDNV